MRRWIFILTLSGCSVPYGRTRRAIRYLIFSQIFYFLADGTSQHISRFDELKKDEGYASGIECSIRSMLSSHSVKRFYRKFYHFHYFKFRELLQKLFIWRLQIEQPSIIILGIDTMVMDNNDAQQRQGVKPTYKKVKGFQPLQLNWMGFMIDAVFRGGDKHSNHSDTVSKMINRVVRQIRKHYSADVPIILRCDRGFFDQKLFHLYEGLDIGYICGGKRYQDIKDYVSQVPGKFWPEKLEDNSSEWSYLEFGDCRKSWDRFRRAFFCTLNIKDGQYIFDFAKQDTIIYTNIGLGDNVDRQLIESGHEDMLKATSIIKCYHNRGNDELVNRAVKDFA
ncbi:MAG: transposase, partial [Actinomycetia bacterium]|nr:transposase [Actinomycetes bacterium]